MCQKWNVTTTQHRDISLQFSSQCYTSLYLTFICSNMNMNVRFVSETDSFHPKLQGMLQSHVFWLLLLCSPTQSSRILNTKQKLTKYYRKKRDKFDDDENHPLLVWETEIPTWTCVLIKDCQNLILMFDSSFYSKKFIAQMTLFKMAKRSTTHRRYKSTKRWRCNLCRWCFPNFFKVCNEVPNISQKPHFTHIHIVIHFKRMF